MKKVTFLFVFFVFLLSACGGGAEPTPTVEVPEEPTLVPTEEPTDVPPEPTQEPTPEPTEEPTPEPTEIPGAEDIINQWLVDAQVVFGEKAEDMQENNGGQFGPGSIKTYNAEENVFTFSDDNGSIWTPLNTHLDQFEGVEPNGEQAILFKFQPSSSSGLGFTFMGPNEFGVDFQESYPGVFWFVEASREAFEGDLVMEDGGWYYILMAIDREGNFRSVVWEDGNPDNHAVFSGAFAERDQGDGYKNQSWKFIIGSGPMTLNVEEYLVYTFSEFAQ